MAQAHGARARSQVDQCVSRSVCQTLRDGKWVDCEDRRKVSLIALAAGHDSVRRKDRDRAYASRWINRIVCDRRLGDRLDENGGKGREVMSRARGQLHTGCITPSTQLEASLTCCAARFTYSSNAALFSFGDTFRRVPSFGSRAKCGHAWKVDQRSGNHFLGAKQRDDACHKKTPGAQRSRTLNTLHGFAQSREGFPRRPLLFCVGPLVGFRGRLAARGGRNSPERDR
jgi:hypothetical protein